MSNVFAKLIATSGAYPAALRESAGAEAVSAALLAGARTGRLANGPGLASAFPETLALARWRTCDPVEMFMTSDERTGADCVGLGSGISLAEAFYLWARTVLDGPELAMAQYELAASLSKTLALYPDPSFDVRSAIFSRRSNGWLAVVDGSGAPVDDEDPQPKNPYLFFSMAGVLRRGAITAAALRTLRAQSGAP